MLDVKKGDRVRLVHANGDKATIVITAVNNRVPALESESNYFYTGDNTWRVEEIIVPPLPTEPGLYAPHGTGTAKHSRLLALAATGQWYWFDLTLGGSFVEAPVYHVEKYAKTIRPLFI